MGLYSFGSASPDDGEAKHPVGPSVVNRDWQAAVYPLKVSVATTAGDDHRWDAEALPASALPRLTRRELQVTLAVAWGMTNAEVGGLLSISARTVECHLGRIYAKLHLRSRRQLLAVVSQQVRPADRNPIRVKLTKRELAVATAAAAGLSNRQVAGSLFISPKTVEFHLAKVYAKLGIASQRKLPAFIGHLPVQVSPCCSPS